MKKQLITADKIRQAARAGQMRLELDASATLITPEAAAVAESLGVELLLQRGKKRILTYRDRQKIIEAVLARVPGKKYSRALIEKAIRDITGG